MTSIEEADTWIGRTAVDNTGEQVGIITKIWVADASGQPEWASVRASLRGREVVVPLEGNVPVGGGRRFAYSKEQIVDAPQSAQGGDLDVADMERLAAHYGAPEMHPGSGSAGWMDRLEDAADGSTVREIRGLLGDDHSAPAPQPEAAAKAGRRLGRKPAPSAKSRFGLSRSAPRMDQPPPELLFDHGEAPAGH